MTLGDRIQELRIKRSLTQDEFGDLIGMKRTNIANYESGRNVPPADTLSKIADVFKVSVDYLLGRTDDPHQIFTDKEEMSPVRRQVITRVTEMLKGDMAEEDLDSAVQFLEFLQSRNAKNKNK